MNMNLIQFKLTNGEELVCEVVQEPDDDDINLVIRNALKIITLEDRETGTRIYSFRPWMVYQDYPDLLQLLNINHILGEAKPNKVLATQFYQALQQEKAQAEANIDDIMERINALKDELNIEFDDDPSDSNSPSNIVNFKSKMH